MIKWLLNKYLYKLAFMIQMINKREVIIGSSCSPMVTWQGYIKGNSPSNSMEILSSDSLLVWSCMMS